ncbi:ferredoxin reductase family protein [Actinocorallia sp. B10E7]|uniref:ferredoxin reductase family protein n=1 Tax=Actinocorallia sp. B10E7 TaxID=3153558 RepID=UPI00325F856C
MTALAPQPTTAPRAGHAPPRFAALLPGPVAGLGALAVLLLWWRTTPSVIGPAGWLTESGRITGLLAGYGAAVLLLLMARIPVLEHHVGTDRLARWHAMAGRYTVGLALAHTLTILWGYTLTSRTDPVTQTVDVLHYPEMLKGTLGFLLMLLVGATSARAARRRLPYEAWHLIHMSSYLAVFAAFSHQLVLGAQFVASPLARVFWYALYLSAAALLAWYRFLTPIVIAFRHRMRVAEVRVESPGVVSVYVTGRRLDELGARAGQFFRWRFLAPDLWWAANPYSLSAAPRPDLLRITVKAAGRHSAALADLRPGTRIWAEGPYGALTADRMESGRALLLGGGVGITPLRALFETLPGDLTLVYLARTPEDLALREELEALAAARGARAVFFVDEPAGHRLPLTASSLRRVVPDLPTRDVYLCGPPGMARAARTALREAGVPRHRIHHESFEF